MKKLFSFVILSLFLISCSPDSGSMNSDPILIKKIVTTYTNGQDTKTVNYTYDGRKLKTVSFNDYLENYSYDGDLIIKSQMYYGDNHVLVNVSNYTYDSTGRLIQSKKETVSTTWQEVYRDTFVYNTDNTVSVNHYYTAPDMDYDPTNGIEKLDSSSKYFFDANNEIVKTEDYVTGGTKITTFTYDEKNNPFKNITGFDKLRGPHSGINFNVIKVDYSGYNEENHASQIKEFTYNAIDFPTTVHYLNTSSTEHYYY